MQVPSICRTCDAKESNCLHNLAECIEKYPDKKLADLLADLTQLDLSEYSSDMMPQSICDDCSCKLQKAYEFMEQARTAHEMLLHHKPKASDCLQEIPMELCPEKHVEVKLETGVEAEIFSMESLKTPVLATSVDGIQIANETDDDISKKVLDPLVMSELSAIKSESDKESSSSDIQDESCWNDDDSLDDLPLQHRAQNWKSKNNVLINKSKSICTRLSKTKCVTKKSLRDPALRRKKVTCQEVVISKRSAHLSDRKKAKEIDTNMCKPHGYKLIQCMICHNKYEKISELRKHLQEHPNVISFEEHETSDLSELIDMYYPYRKKMNEEQLKLRILKDLQAGKFDNFYSITNQSGYEMDLNSSETESETEVDTDEHKITFKMNQKEPYNCELCQQKYQRKYLLYDHQRLSHSWSEAPHICSRCDARFVSSKLLTHHYDSQCRNSQKRYLCHKCPMRFRWKHNLKAHYRDHRTTNQIYECVDCNRIFDKKKSLTVHLLSVHADESQLIPCQWCSRKFYRRDYLVKHLKRHGIKEHQIPLAQTHIEATSKPNGAKNITCKICNLRFERICDLRAHIQIELKLAFSLHQNYESFQNYSITNESGFELQLDDSESDDCISTAAGVVHRVPTLYVCELCNVQCRRKYEMVQHQRAMHRFEKMPYECEHCIFKCVSKQIMDHHKQVQCLNMEKKHVCNHCNYKFMWPENLKQHMLLQHSKAIEPAADDSNGMHVAPEKCDSGVQLLQCPHCDRTYQMQSRLNNHIRDVHINGDRKRKAAIKKFLCSLCGKETQSASNLITHMRRHTGERPFKCDLCEMAFPRHSEMLSHRRMHTGEKPFHCTVCGKDFARSDKLKRHMLTHSGLKPHKCTYCDKSYRQSKDLNLHLQTHTGECPFVCGTCGERFIQSSSLEKHRMMRRHFDEVK